MSGIEIVGFVATVGDLVVKSVLFVDKVRSARKLSAENRPLCDSFARQLAALGLYVDEMQRMQPVELEALGPLWAAAFGQLASHMAAIHKKLSELTSTKSRSPTKAAVVELNNAGDVSAALQYAETKLGQAWSRLQDLDYGRHMVQFAEDCSAGFDRLCLKAETARAEANDAARRDKEEMHAQFSGLTDVLRD